MKTLNLSTLPKAWLVDIDGVIFAHNSYLESGDRILDNVKDFLDSIPKEDCIILLTSRKSKYMRATKNSLKKFGIRYDHIVFDIPKGERILINDKKPRGLKTAVALNMDRNEFGKIKINYHHEK